MNKRKIGKENEEKAVDFLKKQGYKILEVNYTCKIGEIDIIALDGDTTVFIEVKYRKSDKMGMPYEAVNYHKQVKISKVAYVYASKMDLFEKPLRFDVVEIIDTHIKLYKNTFEIKKDLHFL
jgi:putative endonuclease